MGTLTHQYHGPPGAMGEGRKHLARGAGTTVSALTPVHTCRLMRHSLDGHLLAGLHPLAMAVGTPTPAERRVGIVAGEDASSQATAARLADTGVPLSGSSSRIRAAVHLYNGCSDVDARLAALPGVYGLT